MKMDANREAACAALRRAMEAEFAALPAEDALAAPSPALEARMEKLLREEKKAVPFRGRRVLIAAAIVAACLVLVAWTPVGNAVRNLLVTVGGQSVNYQLDPGMRTKIEHLYAPAQLPEGYEESFRELWDDYCFKIVYTGRGGQELEFWQLAVDGINGSIWGEHFKADTGDVGEWNVLFVRPDEDSTSIRTMAYWSRDGYLMELICRGEMTSQELETVILSVKPTE